MTMRGKFSPRLGALLGGILCLAALLFACGRGGDADPGEGETVVGNGPRCILIGIDSASWDDLDPLLESGQLPNLERLRREGAWGTLKSFHPTLDFRARTHSNSPSGHRSNCADSAGDGKCGKISDHRLLVILKIDPVENGAC